MVLHDPDEAELLALIANLKDGLDQWDEQPRYRLQAVAEEISEVRRRVNRERDQLCLLYEGMKRRLALVNRLLKDLETN